jgi:cell division protein FtsN
MTTYRRDVDPTDRPLAFDGRDYAPRRGPAPVTLIVSLLILAGVGGGVFYLYRGGVRAPSGAPAPVGSPVGDVRVAAPPQAQTPDPAAGLSVYKDVPNSVPAAPSFVAPPEQPAPRPDALAASPAMAAAAPTGPIAAAPLGAPRVPAAVAQTVVPAGAQVIEAPTPKSVKAAKAPSIDTLLADSSPAPKATATAKSPTAAKSIAAAKAPAGGFAVQIGAFSSETQADKSWDSAAGLAPGDMAGKGKHVAQTAKDGATLYRVAITGFGTRASAEAMCAKLVAAGRTCFVR